MALRAYGKNVLVLPDEAERVTGGGIIIPENVQEPPVTGEVMSVGGRCQDILKMGDSVIFQSFSGSTVEYGDKEYRMLPERDILGILSN